MRTSIATSLAGLAAVASAQTWPYNLIGTWSTKSNKTLTGPVSSPAHKISPPPSPLPTTGH